MFPEATFSPGAEPDKIAVFARPDDQAAIKAAIEELAKEDPKSAKQMAVYTVKLHGVPSAAGIVWDILWMSQRGIIARPDIRERFTQLGIDPVGNTPAQFTRFLQDEVAKWAKVIKDANVKIDN